MKLAVEFASFDMHKKVNSDSCSLCTLLEFLNFLRSYKKCLIFNTKLRVGIH